MPEPVIASVGASPIGRTDLPGRDLFSVALAEAFDGLPDPADVDIGDPVELAVREPTAAEREIALDYEADWPIHVFEPR